MLNCTITGFLAILLTTGSPNMGKHFDGYGKNADTGRVTAAKIAPVNLQNSSMAGMTPGNGNGHKNTAHGGANKDPEALSVIQADNRQACQKVLHDLKPGHTAVVRSTPDLPELRRPVLKPGEPATVNGHCNAKGKSYIQIKDHSTET